MKDSISKLAVATLILLLALLAGCKQTTETIYYVHSDHLNAPTAVTDQDKAVVWEGQRKPFGETEVTVALIEQNIRFPGQYIDEETGLYYNYFRDYDPSTGRYLQSDPIGLAGGLNTFAYVGGNPIRYTDPRGEDLQEIIDSGWDVGPWDAYWSDYGDAAEAKKSANQTLVPGPDGKPKPLSGQSHNAYLHCVWACLMAQRMGLADAIQVGVNHEEAGQRGSNSLMDMSMDLYNNQVGSCIGSDSGGKEFACQDGCLEQLISGGLRQIDGHDLIPTNGQ